MIDPIWTPLHYGVITRGLPSKNDFCIGYTIRKQTLTFKVCKNGFEGTFEMHSNFPIFETNNILIIISTTSIKCHRGRMVKSVETFYMFLANQGFDPRPKQAYFQCFYSKLFFFHLTTILAYSQSYFSYLVSLSKYLKMTKKKN